MATQLTLLNSVKWTYRSVKIKTFKRLKKNSTEHKPNETATKVPPLGRPVIITGGGDGGGHIDCSLVRRNLLPVKYLGAQILVPIRYFIFEGRRDLYYENRHKCILFINFEKKA